MVVSALCAFPVAPAAQDASTEAAAAFDQGTQYFGRGQWALALESFQAAYRLRAHPAVLLNVATCLDRLGRAVPAVTEYQRYLRLRGSGIEHERRRFVDDALRRLTPQVALLAVALPAPGAAVAIDGTLVVIGEDPIVVPPGPHRVESRASDGRYTRVDILADAGSRQNVALRFPSGPSQAAPGQATVPAPATPPAAPSPQPRSDGDPAAVVAPGREPRDGGGWDPSLRWVGLGATAVLGGLLVYTASRTLALADEYERTDDPETRDEGLTYRTVTEFVFFPATLLAAGFTVLAFVFAADTDESPGTTAAVLPMPDGLILAARGSL
ncbi:MAG: tetratricopeptide repeat protein [Deltaproteobacteria bacterium]|nr:tetratricopeptide repeat protein [Deltaproteobacteria bacterium]